MRAKYKVPLFKIKTKQNLGYPNKEYHAFFKHINQNDMAAEVKKLH